MAPRLHRFIVLIMLVAACAALHAQPRAWLDRARIAPGESVTLNVENDRDEAPDYAPLEADFDIDARTSSTRFEMYNGRASLHTQFSARLTPHRAGVLTVPALVFGNGRTSPLRLQVDGTAAAVPTRAGGEVFVESVPDAGSPYVQQSVGWVVRLYSSVSIVSGQLDQAAPDGASLQRIGDDAQYVREIGGTRYQVVERRFLLVPERSGALTVPGATFRGRAVAGFFDRVFGDGVKDLAASAAPRTLQVRPMPANAPQPWLPLRSLQLHYRAVPESLVAGSAATLEIESVADGANGTQLPDLELPPVPGLQVFPEAPQRSDRVVEGRPVATLVRRYALVPQRGGLFVLQAPRIAWWDVVAGRARVASLPELRLQASGAAPKSTGTAAGSQTAPWGGRAPASPSRNWVLATVGFALLWLLTLGWALRARRAEPAGAAAQGAGEPAAPDTTALRRALASGDLSDISDALHALGPFRTLDELAAQLDPAQRQALDVLQHARWGGGDASHAREQLRRAFAQGPRLRQAARVREPLPPLYPPA